MYRVQLLREPISFWRDTIFLSGTELASHCYLVAMKSSMDPRCTLVVSLFILSIIVVRVESVLIPKVHVQYIKDLIDIFTEREG